MKEEIKGKTQIILDEDVSREKIEFLISLNIEEERLDFKKSFDISTKALTKKSKVNLVCDIISMANTEGGYIIIGVEEKKSDFSICGITEEVNLYLSPENVSNIVSAYVEYLPKIIINSHEFEDKIVCAIFVGRAKVPIPFKQLGQYNENSKNTNKFSVGEVYVRHSAKCERANFHDWQDFVARIRSDEREKDRILNRTQLDINSRLDQIIIALGGQTKVDFSFDISNHKEIDVENYFSSVISQPNSNHLFRRICNKIFSQIKSEITKAIEINERFEAEEKIQRIVDLYFIKLIPIWYLLNIQNPSFFIGYFSNKIYSIYQHTFEILENQSQKFDQLLIVQLELLKLVYVLAAISLNERKYNAAQDLIERKGDLRSNEHKEAFWFRYVMTWLHRRAMIKIASLVYIANDSYKDNEYLIELIDGNVRLKTLISQVDYFQCLLTYLNGGDKIDCYPSFRVFGKKNIELFLNDYIFSSRFTEEHQNAIREAIIKLENYETANHWGWYNEWTLKRLEDFMSGEG